MSYVVCLSNEGSPASLEPLKLYEVIPDPESATKGYARVIDESGEDYLYPTRMFAALQLPENIESALKAA